MDVRSPLFQNIALIVAGVLFLNPIVATAAQLAVDQAAGGNTAVTQAQNGVPMVNIATPNGSGLSHNKFTDYNVGQQGLILNNSAQNVVQTQLGGYVVGNPNLKNGAAGLILNEVTGGNASQLKGYTEVAGRSAAVIVANPHGITCDGCGFINTPRVTLSTGTPVIENGRLQRFDVDGGQISIEGQGLNAGNVDQFDLITRSAQINAELHAKKLNIITGRNEVDATTLAATAKADDGSDKPMLAIDSSALGGMYAGAIRLVGTEQGVGVKLAGDMAASAGDIQIDANGKLSLNRVAASGDVALKANTIDLNADTYAGRNATLEAQQVEVRESLAASQRLTVQAEQLNNAGIIEAGVRANGSVSSAGHLQLDGGKVRNAGEMTSHGSMATDLQTLDNAGGKIATAGGATLKAEQLDNREGEILAQGNLTLDAARLDNRAGSALAGQALAIEAEAVDNRAGTLAAGGAIEARVTNALNNDGGLVEAGGRLDVEADSLSNTDGRLRALGSGGESRFAIGTRLNNDEGVLEVGSAVLTVDAESLSNQGGVVRHLGSGGLGLDMQLLGQAGGEFITNSAVSLSAEEWVNRSLLQAASIELDVQRLTQTATGGLLSVAGLAVQADSWTNDGRIETDGDLSLILSGDYRGNGTLISKGHLELEADNIQLGSDARLRSAGHGRLVALGELVNNGQLTAGTWLNLAASALKNKGTVGAGGELLLVAQDIGNEDGLFFSGEDMRLFGQRIENRRGDLYSLGNLLIAADAQGGMAERLSNLSGTVESAGTLAIAARQIENARESFEIASRKYSARLVHVGCIDCSGTNEDALFRLDEYDRTEVVSGSASASMLAAGDMHLSSETLDNRYSQIAAGGDLHIDTGRLTNQGAQTGEVFQSRVLQSHRVRASRVRAQISAANSFSARNWHGSSGYNPTNLQGELNNFFNRHVSRVLSTSEPVLSNIEYHHATIQAAGDLRIEADEQINNSLIRPSFSYVAGGSRDVDTSIPGDGISTTITLNPQLPPDLQQKAVDPLSLPGFSLPSGQNGLFSLNTNPGHRYLIETNPAFANLGNFLNSDYMLGLLGFDPDEMQRRLGDGLYEQRLVRDAILARTGQRYLAGLDSDEAQFRYLMDNAIASKEALNLSLGITLSAEQIAALTHDIVWMEEREVQGHKVLVPVLYLAQAEGRLAPSGALIQGRDVALISGGDLSNQGTLRASDNLSVTAANIGNSGLMLANQRLQLLATDSIRNAQGGIIAGNDVSLFAVNDISNERSVTTHESSSGDRYQHRRDFIDSAARIEAGTDLQVSAGNDIRNIGGAISAGGDASLQAGNDLILASAETVDEQKRRDRKGHTYRTDITQYGSDVQVGGDLTAVAGRDLLMIGSTVKAGGDIGLGAGGDMTVASAANESSFDHYRKSGGKKVVAQEQHVRQVASVIEAGGNLDMRTDGNLLLVASQLKAGNEAYLYAGEQLALLAAQNSDYSLYDKKKKGGWGSKETQRDEVTTVRNVGSSITTGGDLILVSEGDQLYQKARLESGSDLILDSGGSITFEAVKDLDQESHEKSSNSLAWTSAKGKGSTDETLYQSQLIAKGDLVIQAVDGLKIDVKEVNQQSVSQTIDAMVKADPELAWLKEMEQRGDVDWRQVKEIHDSFKYSHSGLGAGAAMIIAIVVTVLTAGAGAAGAGAAITTATSTAGVAASNAVFASVVTQATVSTINNRGNLSAVAKDITSKDAAKGYIASGVTAGVGGYMGFSPADLGFNWDSAGQLATKTAIDAGIRTALYGGSLKGNLAEAAIGNAVTVAGAIGADAIGGLELKSGSLEKIALHAALGGLLAEASGGDFRTGALAAGASEALVDLLAEKFLPQGEDRTSPEYQQGMRNLVAASQIIGVLAAGLTGGDVQAAAAVAANATANNYLRHQDVDAMVKALEGCDQRGDCQQIRDDFRKISDANRARLAQCEQNGNCEAIKAEIAEGKAALDKLQGYALAVAEADFNTRQWQDGNSVQTILSGQANRSAESAAERSQRQEAEKLVEVAKDPEGLKQLTEMRAQAAYRADLEQKLLADAEVQRLAQQSAADLAADLDQLMPGWRTHREQSLDFVDGVKQGGVLLADVVSPDAWDLLGPSAKAAKLAGIFAGVGKVSGKVSADLVESAAKLNNLLAGKTPSSAELAPFTKAAERQLAEEIKLANQTLAKKPVAASGVPKGTPDIPATSPIAREGLRNDLLAAQAKDPRIGTVLPGAKAPVTVTAESSIGGRTLVDTNQTARPVTIADPNKPTLIADLIPPGKPNSTMANAHAEIGLIQQAFDAGLTKGQAMTVVVRGEEVCSYCKSQLTAAADRAGLNSLQVVDTVKGRVYEWVRGAGWKE
jgi:filamentous hemagglutinin family protein